MKKRKLILIFWLAMGLGIFSCQKMWTDDGEINTLSDPVDASALVKAAKQHYHEGLKERMITGFQSRFSQSMQSGQSKASIRRAESPPARVYALWKKARVSGFKGRKTVEVPFHSSHRVVSLIKIARDDLGYTPDRTMIKTIFDRLLLSKRENGEGFNAKVVRYHPDRTYLEKHGYDVGHIHLYELDGFTGYLEYLTLEGRRRAVVRVVDGKPVKRYWMGAKRPQAKSKTSKNKSVTTMGGWDCYDVCEEILGEICVGSGGGTADDPGEEECFDVVIGFDCWEECDGGEDDEGDFCEDAANWDLPECGGDEDDEENTNIFSEHDFENSTIEQDNKPKITNIQKYFNCFNDGKTAAQYKITIYANQPIPNTSNQFAFNHTPTTSPDGIGIVKHGSGGMFEVGHAFIGLEKINTDNSVVRQVIGFYPDGTGIAPGPGAIKDNGGDPYDVSYSRTITEAQFDTVKDAIIDDFNGADYVLFQSAIFTQDEYNCADAALNWINLTGANIPHTPSGSFTNTPADLGQTLRNLPGANTNGGNAPASTGPCN